MELGQELQPFRDRRRHLVLAGLPSPHLVLIHVYPTRELALSPADCVEGNAESGGGHRGITALSADRYFLIVTAAR